ncbi:MAG: acylneuraminate cytidylyltransferase family protein [Planctomycetes bacterium]|nr:acylneuraminate cytidylyltransferase family protein [Planctomycetota bacterium]
MTWDGMKVLAVIPARGGSKGIPRKNLRQVGGISLIGWAAKCAHALSWIDAVVLSTDDEEMAAEGRAQGLEVPFLRPPEFATDVADAIGMWRHAWLESERAFGQRFDLSILLQPTTPLRNPADVERTLRALVEGGHRSATTVSPVPGHFTPEKTLRRDDRGRLSYYLAEGARHSNRQSIPDYCHRNGICYAVDRETLVDCGRIIADDCVGVMVEGFVVNIDEPIELELAEFMFERQRRAGSIEGE